MQTSNNEDKKQIRKVRLWVKLVVIIFIAITSTILYSRYIGTTGLSVKEYLIIDKDLPSTFSGIKIAHISDIHYGQTVNKKELQTLVNRVNEYKPDIIVITGDLLDQDMKYSKKDIKNIETTLSKLKATLGKYIIMGNHDNTQDNYINIVENSDLINLDDSYKILYHYGNKPILIAGMSTGQLGNQTPNEKVAEAISTIKENKISYSILIMHEPDYIDDIEYNNFDLVLAGHSHGGQVKLPLIGALVVPSHAKEYYDDYYKLDNTDLYISSGVGTSRVKFRLFNRPSFNLYRIVDK